jgi:hypothetical protein
VAPARAFLLSNDIDLPVAGAWPGKPGAIVSTSLGWLVWSVWSLVEATTPSWQKSARRRTDDVGRR